MGKSCADAACRKENSYLFISHSREINLIFGINDGRCLYNLSGKRRHDATMAGIKRQNGLNSAFIKCPVAPMTECHLNAYAPPVSHESMRQR